MRKLAFLPYVPDHNSSFRDEVTLVRIIFCGRVGQTCKKSHIFSVLQQCLPLPEGVTGRHLVLDYPVVNDMHEYCLSLLSPKNFFNKSNDIWKILEVAVLG